MLQRARAVAPPPVAPAPLPWLRTRPRGARDVELTYADPTGDTAARHIDGERRRRRSPAHGRRSLS